MPRRRHDSARMILAGLVVVGLGVLASPTRAAVVREFANGIRATIHGADEVLVAAKHAAGAEVLEIATTAGSLTLDAATDGLVPFDAGHVERALAAMHGFTTDVDVAVYILPGLPTATGGSFARRDAIYLAPGTGPVPESTVAYITTHEMGHVLTWACLDGRPGRWDAYLQLRGLDGVTNGPDADHADRAREILAEDIRHLFGGPEATRTGSIENHDLVLPDRVAGLAALLAGYFGARGDGLVAAMSNAYPNPCNPRTTIAMVVPDAVTDGAQARLQVFDLRGALLRTITGGTLANGRIAVQWDGTGDDGRTVGSGRYLYLMSAGGLTARGSVSVVR